MNRNSGNVSSAKKSFPGRGNNSKADRKSFRHLSESSSMSSDRHSSARSVEDVRIPETYVKPQTTCELSCEEQERLVKKLKGQVKELRHRLRVLEESVESKDYSLGMIAKEKDRATGEIRRLERSNKQLRQQLNDERCHYLEEKERFCEEMTRCKKKLQEARTESETKKTPTATRQPLINRSLRWQLNNEKGDFTDIKPPSSSVKMSKSQNLPEKTPLDSFTLSESQLPRTTSLKSVHFYEGDDVSLQIAALRTENAKLRSIICERDERNYELCLRFLRMKHYKNDIKSRFHDLENEYLQVIANLMDKIDEARQEFNFIIDQKFKRPLHSTNAMYLQLVQKNSRMAFENASLRLENQCLKKELNKYANSVCERDRNLAEAGAENADVRLSLRDSNSDGKLKRTKKNVNFKEIRTIYDRSFAFKSSETDSNWVSKTSTAVTSNQSVPEVKSTESVLECEPYEQEKPSMSFQANALPEDLLKKIFKRIDTPSCQTLDSLRSRRMTSSDVTIKFETASDAPKEVKTKKRAKDEASAKKTDNGLVIIEHKSPPKLTDSSFICDSKESVELKEFPRLKSYSPTELVLRTEEEEEEFLDGRTLRNGVRGRAIDYRCQDAGEEVEATSGGRWVKRNTLGRRERIHQSNDERQYLKKHSRMQQFKDCCGLQEKLDITEKELPLQHRGEGRSEIMTGVCRGEREKAEDAMTRTESRESEDEEEGVVTGKERVRYLSPAIGSRSKSSNKVNLQDELMDALRIQRQSGDRAQRKEVRSKSSTSSIAIKENNASTVTEQAASARRTEGSKRFSHRLVSTSPETLRNILTDSQGGASYRIGPLIVGHATTDVNSAFKATENNNKIFLQLLIPKSTIEGSSQMFVNKGMAVEKTTVEKETSMSGLTSLKSSTKMETCPSGVRVPIPDLQASNSTIEMVESGTVNDKNDIMLRTLSAPGLLESDWLDQYTLFEIKNSSTNT